MTFSNTCAFVNSSFSLSALKLRYQHTASALIGSRTVNMDVSTFFWPVFYPETFISTTYRKIKKSTFPPYLLRRAGCQYLEQLMGFTGRGVGVSGQCQSHLRGVSCAKTRDSWTGGLVEGEPVGGGDNSREKTRGNS